MWKSLKEFPDVFPGRKQKPAQRPQQQAAERKRPQGAAQNKCNGQENAQSAGLKNHQKKKYADAGYGPEQDILQRNRQTAVGQQPSEDAELVKKCSGTDTAAEKCQKRS